MENPRDASPSTLSSTLKPISKDLISIYDQLTSKKHPNYPEQDARLHSIACQIFRFVHSLPVYIERLLPCINFLTKNDSDFPINLDSCTKEFIDCISIQICQSISCEDEELSKLIQNQSIPIADLLRKTMVMKLKRLIWKDQDLVNLVQATNKILNFLKVYGFYNTKYLGDLVTYILSDNSDAPKGQACISYLEDLCYLFFGEYQSFNAYRIVNSIYKLIEPRLIETRVFDSHLKLKVRHIPEEVNESIYLQWNREITIINNPRVNVFGKYIDQENINKINFDPKLSNLSQIHMCIVNLDDGFYCIDTSYSEEEFYNSIVWKRISPEHPIILQPGMIIRMGNIRQSQIFEVLSINGNEIRVIWKKGEKKPNKEKSHLILGELIIGREVEKAGILLNNNEISRKHAKFELIEGKIYFKDLKSTNFTYFGLKRRSQIDNQEFSAFEKIDEGDIIAINDYIFQFQYST